jgi:hypothetical protein
MSSASPATARRHDPKTSRRALWFGMLGGGAAWLVHLVAAYAFAEFGCVGRLRQVSLAGLTAVAWLIIGVSVLTLLIAVASALTAYRSERRLRATQDDLMGTAAEVEVARTGWVTSGLFVLVILVESLPIFYYLKDC